MCVDGAKLVWHWRQCHIHQRKELSEPSRTELFISYTSRKFRFESEDKMVSSHKASQKHKDSLHLLLGKPLCPVPPRSPKGKEGIQWRPDRHSQAARPPPGSNEGKPSLHTGMAPRFRVSQRIPRMCAKHLTQCIKQGPSMWKLVLHLSP